MPNNTSQWSSMLMATPTSQLRSVMGAAAAALKRISKNFGDGRSSSDLLSIHKRLVQRAKVKDRTSSGTYMHELVDRLLTVQRQNP